MIALRRLNSMKRTFASSLLAVALLLIMVQHHSIATAVGFDSFYMPAESAMSDGTVNADADKLNDSTAFEQKKSGNRFVRAISAPFRAIGRLFGGGKKNDQLARRISNKDAEKFEGHNNTTLTR